jgi:hypothetical protein
MDEVCTIQNLKNLNIFVVLSSFLYFELQFFL